MGDIGARHGVPATMTDGVRASGTLRHLIRGFRVHGLLWLTDIAAVNAAFLAAAFVRYGGHIPTTDLGRLGLVALVLITASYTLFDLLFRTYRVVWRFASVLDMAVLALTVLGVVVVVGVVELGPMVADRPVPLSVLVLGGALAYLVLAQLKLVLRARQAVSRAPGAKPLIVFGAGAAGLALVGQLAQERRKGYRPVAFLDDDPAKAGRDIAGLPVAGTRDALARAVQRYHADAVAIAIPSAESRTVRELTHRVLDAGARALVVPSITELMAGTELSLRDVGIEDLFGRAEVTVDEVSIRAAFTGRRVLITGAAGSIGSELARHVALLRPACLDLLDINETGLAELRDELRPHGLVVRIIIASVTDEPAICAAFDSARPQVVIHAAAYKHVDIVEEQPRPALDVNVCGTWACATAAGRVGSERFIFISTDKAVDPEGVLGATKRAGELMMASLSTSATVFAAVRFGNVLNSRGSVLPRFERQISQGGPITVTHPDVRRFFMSIAEAVRLVLQSAAIAQGGRTYVLDLGEEMSIAGLAQRLVRFRGLRVPEDIEVVFTGLRPGERLREKLVGERETATPTKHPKVMQVEAEFEVEARRWDEVVPQLMTTAPSYDAPQLRSRLLAMVTSNSGAVFAP